MITVFNYYYSISYQMISSSWKTVGDTATVRNYSEGTHARQRCERRSCIATA